tara:strand:- start:71 stop:508 length:438 start_codon:yes stop_codon:yes gene_type:complete
MLSERIYRYTLYREQYYDRLNREYKYIVTINTIPEGPLKNHIKMMSIEDINNKIFLEKTCKLVIFNNELSNDNNNSNNISKNISKNINNYQDILEYENLADLINYLLENSYTIDETILNSINDKSLMNKTSKKIILFFKYKQTRE